jgi:hypothetical protein
MFSHVLVRGDNVNINTYSANVHGTRSQDSITYKTTAYASLI